MRISSSLAVPLIVTEPVGAWFAAAIGAKIKNPETARMREMASEGSMPKFQKGKGVKLFICTITSPIYPPGAGPGLRLDTGPDCMYVFSA